MKATRKKNLSAAFPLHYTLCTCSVGRLRDKGIPELVDSFVRLHAEHPEARLVLIGPEEPELDPLPEETRSIMKEHPSILCPGRQRNIPEWLAATDVYTLPSHREGFCNSLLEAGAMALPSITYDICGCNDSVDEETGILVPPYEAESLSWLPFFDSRITLLSHHRRSVPF